MLNIIWFSDLKEQDIKIAGANAVTLSALYNSRFPIPSGFVLTEQAYNLFLQHKQNENFPETLKKEILEAYDNLNIDREISKTLANDVLNSMIRSGRDMPFIAVRPSSEQQSYLNIKGREELISSIKKLWHSNGSAIIVQKMINSEKSGRIFINPSKEEIIIKAINGLGHIMDKVGADSYIVNRETLNIKSRDVGNQMYGIFRDINTGRNIQKNLSEEIKQKISDKEISDLSNYAIQIQNSLNKPLEIEFAIEGNKIFIIKVKELILDKPIEEKYSPNLELNIIQVKEPPETEEDTRISFSFGLPKDIYEEIQSHPEIDWEEIVKQTLIEKTLFRKRQKSLETKVHAALNFK